MFLTIEICDNLDDDNYELTEIDINPMHIESMEEIYTRVLGEGTSIIMASGQEYIVNIPKEELKKVIAFNQLKTFFS